MSICLTETNNYVTLSCNHSFIIVFTKLLYMKIMSNTDILLYLEIK